MNILNNFLKSHSVHLWQQDLSVSDRDMKKMPTAWQGSIPDQMGLSQALYPTAQTIPNKKCSGHSFLFITFIIKYNCCVEEVFDCVPLKTF